MLPRELGTVLEGSVFWSVFLHGNIFPKQSQWQIPPLGLQSDNNDQSPTICTTPDLQIEPWSFFHIYSCGWLHRIFLSVQKHIADYVLMLSLLLYAAMTRQCAGKEIWAR